VTTRLRRSERRGEPSCGSRNGRKFVVRALRIGFHRFAGRACGSFRLQKSTSGAWHRTPASEELAEAAESSPSSLQRRAKERRKPVRDGKVQGTVAGSRSRGVVKTARRAGNSSVEGASGRESRFFLTKRRRKRSWRCSRVSAQERRDRERQRQVLPPRARLKRPSRRGAVRGVHRSRDPYQERTAPAPASDDARSVVDPAEAGVRTVKCAATRVVRWGFGPNGRVARANSAGATSRVERTCRCSCRDCSCRRR